MEKLCKAKVKKEEEHTLGIEDVIAEVKSNVVEAIWEAKIKLAEDVENVRSWNVAGWREILAKLTGKLVDDGQDPTEKKRRKRQSIS